MDIQNNQYQHINPYLWDDHLQTAIEDEMNYQQSMYSIMTERRINQANRNPQYLVRLQQAYVQGYQSR